VQKRLIKRLKELKRISYQQQRQRQRQRQQQ